MNKASDIRLDNWIDRFVPVNLRPYARLARLDRPIGTWLLLFPCWWSISLANSHKTIPDIKLMVLFAIGALIMRGAGCTINDMVDREVDAKVVRTAMRPLASGALSLKQAWVFLGLQLGLGFLILVQLPLLAIMLGAASLLLVATYPFMKRITWWPQAFLGLTFNWGALLGWAAARDSLAAAPLWLYGGGLFWTLFYDTIYAHQDKIDDALIGVKSTALRLGVHTKKWLAGFLLLTIICFGTAFIAADSGIVAYLGLLGVAIHLSWQLYDVDIDDAEDCLTKFRSNRFVGWILLIGILIDRL